MLRIKSCLIITLFLNLNSFSQTFPSRHQDFVERNLRKKNVLVDDTVTLIYDNPQGLKILALELPIYAGKFSNMENGAYELRFGFNYISNNKWNGGFSQKFTLLSVEKLLNHEYELNPYKPIKFSNEFDGNLRFNFFENTKIKKRSIIHNTDHNTITYSLHNIQEIRKMCLNLGLIAGNLKFDLWDRNLRLLSYTNQNNVILYEESDQYTIQNYVFMKLGIVMSTTTDFSAETKKYGKNPGTKFLSLSSNLIMAVHNKFRDVVTSYPYYGNNARFIFDPNYKDKSPFGFEVAGKYWTRGNNLSIDMSFRYHPGPSIKSSLMFMYSLSYQIDFFHLKRNNFNFRKPKQ